MRFVLLLLLVFSSAWAAEDRISVQLDRVSLVDLVRVAYDEIEGGSYVLSPDFLQSRESASLSLRNITRGQLLLEVQDLLRGAGYTVASRAGVVLVKKAAPEEETELLYRPKYRATSYIVDLLSPVFPSGAFTVQRGIQAQMPATVGRSQSIGGGSRQWPPGSQGPRGSRVSGGGSIDVPPVDDGTSAFSLLDKDVDAFVFKGTAKDVTRLTRLLHQVDTPTPEVLVKAVVFEVSNGAKDRSAIGLAVELLNGKLGARIGAATPGDYSAVFRSARIDAVYDALASDSRFKVVSSPTLRVRSGGSANLTVGADAPVLGAVQYNQAGQAIQSVEYQSAGVILDLKPRIREEETELQASLQISSFVPTTTGVSGSPTKQKRQLSTTVGVRADDVLVLGGLDQDQSTDSSSGLSFLPDWMRSKSSDKQHSEILLILQAQRI